VRKYLADTARLRPVLAALRLKPVNVANSHIPSALADRIAERISLIGLETFAEESERTLTPLSTSRRQLFPSDGRSTNGSNSGSGSPHGPSRAQSPADKLFNSTPPSASDGRSSKASSRPASDDTKRKRSQPDPEPPSRRNWEEEMRKNGAFNEKDEHEEPTGAPKVESSPSKSSSTRSPRTLLPDLDKLSSKLFSSKRLSDQDQKEEPRRKEKEEKEARKKSD